MIDLSKLLKFQDKTFRDGYLQTSVRGWIAYQIQALREKTGLTQQAFAEKLGKKQSTISRLENSEYGKVTVQTLLDIASALDVALQVRFVDYPEFLRSTNNFSVSAMQPSTIFETLERNVPFQRNESGGALERAIRGADQWQPAGARKSLDIAFDNSFWKSAILNKVSGHANENASADATHFRSLRSAVN